MVLVVVAAVATIWMRKMYLRIKKAKAHMYTRRVAGGAPGAGRRT